MKNRMFKKQYGFSKHKFTEIYFNLTNNVISVIDEYIKEKQLSIDVISHIIISLQQVIKTSDISRFVYCDDTMLLFKISKVISASEIKGINERVIKSIITKLYNNTDNPILLKEEVNKHKDYYKALVIENECG